MILSSFTHFRSSESGFSVSFWFWSETESEWDEIFFLWDETKSVFFWWNETEPDFFSVKWDRIRFYFHEMRQNQILFSWNETELEIFSWNEMKQKTKTVLMRWNQVFVRQNISFWFFSQFNLTIMCSSWVMICYEYLSYIFTFLMSSNMFWMYYQIWVFMKATR